MMEFFASDGFLQSLIESRQYLTESALLKKLDEVIELELELAKIGSEKALQEVKKQEFKENNVKPIGDKK